MKLSRRTVYGRWNFFILLGGWKVIVKLDSQTLHILLSRVMSITFRSNPYCVSYSIMISASRKLWHCVTRFDTVSDAHVNDVSWSTNAHFLPITQFLLESRKDSTWISSPFVVKKIKETRFRLKNETPLLTANVGHSYQRAERSPLPANLKINMNPYTSCRMPCPRIQGFLFLPCVRCGTCCSDQHERLPFDAQLPVIRDFVCQNCVLLLRTAMLWPLLHAMTFRGSTYPCLVHTPCPPSLTLCHPDRTPCPPGRITAATTTRSFD